MTAMQNEALPKTVQTVDQVPLTSVSVERPSRDAMHKILTDETVEKPQWGPMKTLGGLQQLRDAQRKRDFGEDTATHPSLSPLDYRTDPTFSKFARIVTAPTIGADALTIKITVFSNMEHMADPYDLVPVTLESDDKTTLDTIAVLTLSPDSGNICTFDARYTYAQLARLLKLDVPKDAAPGKILEQITGLYPQLGVKAQWFTSKDGHANSANHTSGGMLEKDGSGKIRLRPVTAAELKATETQRNTEWNAGEVLSAGRPVYDAYQDILREGKQLATTLEAESEYLLAGLGDFKAVLRQMVTLSKDVVLQKKFGIVRMKDEGIKQYTDTYYDIDGQLMLLRGKIVLRRRSVDTDPEGTFLFSVKGPSLSSKTNQRDKIRLAAQVQLLNDPGKLPTGRLEAFISDSTTPDNAFARVLIKGLEAVGTKLPQQKWALYPALVIESNRTKYSMELDNSTTVEFSADVATATFNGRKATLYAIEFGVGHPGLVVNTIAATTVDAPAPGSSSGSTAPSAPQITRPYHVPDDLALALFQKPDYVQFTMLRNKLLTDHLAMVPEKLTLGGNKASTLAEKLKML